MADKEVRPHTLVGLNRDGMYKIFADKGFTKGCEVGVHLGTNALSMLSIIPELHLTLIEPYMTYEYRRFRTRNKWKWDLATMDKIRRKALRKLSKSNVRWLMTTSELASKCVEDESLDFVYIDGNHSFDFITRDIQFWAPKIRKGGIISGHDYGIKPIRSAVDAFAKYHEAFVQHTDHREEPSKSKARIMISWMIDTWRREKE